MTQEEKEGFLDMLDYVRGFVFFIECEFDKPESKPEILERCNRLRRELADFKINWELISDTDLAT